MSTQKKQKKLSRTQRDVLEYAASLVGRRDKGLYFSEPGWFIPMFTTRGSIDFFSRPQTSKSLVRLGLLEERIDGRRWDKYRGLYVDEPVYRITQAGLDRLESESR